MRTPQSSISQVWLKTLGKNMEIIKTKVPSGALVRIQLNGQKVHSLTGKIKEDHKQIMICTKQMKQSQIEQKINAYCSVNNITGTAQVFIRAIYPHGYVDKDMKSRIIQCGILIYEK